MIEKTIIEIARNEAERQGWSWVPPVNVTKRKRFLVFGKLIWYVSSNVGRLGRNVWMIIDDETGIILQKGFCPR
jgi:hypothetical protein